MFIPSFLHYSQSFSTFSLNFPWRLLVCLRSYATHSVTQSITLPIHHINPSSTAIVSHFHETRFPCLGVIAQLQHHRYKVCCIQAVDGLTLVSQAPPLKVEEWPSRSAVAVLGRAMGLQSQLETRGRYRR